MAMPVESNLTSGHVMPVRILCVDDERNVLRALERLFIDEEYEIVTCASGEEGLQELATGGEFQIVISDYRMPGMNGVEFLKQVYARWPETVRIVLSGYADSGAIVDAINHGHIYKFIPKPWNDDELRVTIVNSLERFQLRLENEVLLRKLKESNDELRILNANLEDFILERTRDLELRNHALSFNQILLENLPIAVLGIDVHGMIIQCNRCCLELLAPLKREILGENFTAIFPENECLTAPAGDENVLSQRGTWNIAGRMIEVTMRCYDVFESRACVAVLMPEKS